MEARKAIWKQNHSVLSRVSSAVGLCVSQSLLVRNQRRKGKVDHRLQESLEVHNRRFFYFFFIFILSRFQQRVILINLSISRLSLVIDCRTVTKPASTSTKAEANVRSVIDASTCTRYQTGPKQTSDRRKVNCVDVVSEPTTKRWVFSSFFLRIISTNTRQQMFKLCDWRIGGISTDPFVGFSGGAWQSLRPAVRSRLGWPRLVHIRFGGLLLGRSRQSLLPPVTEGKVSRNMHGRNPRHLLRFVNPY